MGGLAGVSGERLASLGKAVSLTPPTHRPTDGPRPKVHPAAFHSHRTLIETDGILSKAPWSHAEEFGSQLRFRILVAGEIFQIPTVLQYEKMVSASI